MGQPNMHVEDIPQRTSTNLTVDGHEFHPGNVTHRVHFVGSRLFYDVVGAGTSSDPLGNIYVGISLFTGGVETVDRKVGH